MIEVALLCFLLTSLQSINIKNYRLTNLIKLEPTDSATTTVLLQQIVVLLMLAFVVLLLEVKEGPKSCDFCLLSIIGLSAADSIFRKPGGTVTVIVTAVMANLTEICTFL